MVCVYLRFTKTQLDHGGFHGHRGIPNIAGGFLWTGKSHRSIDGWWLGGTPMTQEPPPFISDNSVNPRFIHRILYPLIYSTYQGRPTKNWDRVIPTTSIQNHVITNSFRWLLLRRHDSQKGRQFLEKNGTTNSRIKGKRKNPKKKKKQADNFPTFQGSSDLPIKLSSWAKSSNPSHPAKVCSWFSIFFHLLLQTQHLDHGSVWIRDPFVLPHSRGQLKDNPMDLGHVVIPGKFRRPQKETVVAIEALRRPWESQSNVKVQRLWSKTLRFKDGTLEGLYICVSIHIYNYIIHII